jgi:hypothetical protein
MEARDVYDKLDGEYEEETIDVARDVAAFMLTSVHGPYITDLQSSERFDDASGCAFASVEHVPAVACRIVWLPSAANSHLRFRRTLSTKFAQSKPVRSAMSTTLNGKLEEAGKRAEEANYFRACWEPLNGKYPHL